MSNSMLPNHDSTDSFESYDTDDDDQPNILGTNMVKIDLLQLQPQVLQATVQLLSLTQETIALVCSLDGNGQCCDCSSLECSWASVSFGILLCLGASSIPPSI